MVQHHSNHSLFNNKKVIIVHGYNGASQKHWFPWLKHELSALGATVYVPDMPNAEFPDPIEWQQHLRDIPVEIDENTIFIGHSLGCVTILRFLERQVANGSQIGGYFLVAGFDKQIDVMPPGLESHVLEPLNYPKLIEISNNRVLFISANDAAVPFGISKALALALQAEVVIEENAGHFLDSEGYTEFPTLLTVLKEYIGE